MINDDSQRRKELLLKWPLANWVFLGLVLTFLAFFIVPVFLGSTPGLRFTAYLPPLSPIGHDFKETVSASSAWLHGRAAPLILYPPLTLVFFAPFTFLNDSVAYTVFVLLILLGYFWITLLLPRWIFKQKKLPPLALLVIITGLASYGLQFELQRGQWNVIAFAFCFTAIYLFHSHPKHRWLAYSLFSISVQLKLYPAIFVFTLIENGSDWKNNIKRFVGLGLVNIAALFIFGIGPVRGMVGSMSNVENFFGEHPYNLSVSAFIAGDHSLGVPSTTSRVIPSSHAAPWLPQLLLFAFFGVCFLIVLWRAYKNNSKGLNPYVLLACTVGALIIPSISFDYKLSILPASIVLLIPVLQSFERGANRLLVIFLTLLFSIAYFSTLYSFANKPEWLQYNLPALFVLLTIGTISSCVREGGIDDTASAGLQTDSNGQ